MQLYLTPGACSLADHIALHEAGLAFDHVRVDLQTRRTEDGRDFSEINPKGYVPALALDDGTLLTEGPAIVQYLADRGARLDVVNAKGWSPVFVADGVESTPNILKRYPEAAALSFILMTFILIGIFIYARALGARNLTEAAI